MGSPILPTDIKRRRTMSHIKNKDTSIELILRKALWRQGTRYRKNYNALPGVPDIVITKYKIAIFCDGEFWHGKNWADKKTRIKNNREYWVSKIERNIMRDREAEKQLRFMGWSVIRFWGSDIRNNLKNCLESINEMIFEGKLSQHNSSCGHIDG
ncbi:MAG: very short patch repair endonuclease [Clostridiales bacterium]|jgi:DNA mismatch endonuclease (patch repair protein)|nr:very short patch repair endonuclease [Clostridiales bacterium]